MRIVMDFDGVFTDPTREGDACALAFRNKIIGLGASALGAEAEEAVDAWLGELRVRQAVYPFDYGWRSEGRVSAFASEDPFLRTIGLADFLDHLVHQGESRARGILAALEKTDGIRSFGELSEWAFHQLHLKKYPDPQAKKWVQEALDRGHEVHIVSNSATDKIREFLDQAGFDPEKRPVVRGGARKFGLGTRPQTLKIGRVGTREIEVDTDRPRYEEALMELQPDAVIGDVFCLDLALPIRLRREKRLPFSGGIFYRHRDYTPSCMLDLIGRPGSSVPEVKIVRDWEQLSL